MEQTIRDLILTAKSLARAMPELRKVGLPPDAMAALEAAADAESQLATKRGQTGDRSKISQKQIAEIEKLLKSGKSYGEIAKATGLSKGTIFKRGKTILNLGEWKVEE